MWYAAGNSLQYSNGLPQMKAAFTNWFLPITFIKLTTAIVDYEAVTVEETINTKGVVQPLKAQEIALKPEEQRAWTWQQIHCEDDLNLVIGDKLIFKENIS